MMVKGHTADAPLPGLAQHEELFAIYDRMVGDVHIPTVLREVADVVCHDLHAERATVYLINRETEELESVAVVGNVGQIIRVPIQPSSLAGFCATTCRSFLVPDAYGDLSNIDPRLRFDRSWDERNNFRTRDVLCAPAMFKGQALGVVQVINSKSGQFTPKNLPLLNSLARLIGYALYHAKLYDDLATMKKLEKEKAQFMRVMVHELKSPAAATKMLTQLAEIHLQKVDSPKITELNGRIAGRMDQLLNLIKDILVLAQAKSGDPMGEIAVLDITREVDEVCQNYRSHARQKKGSPLLLERRDF
jgi:GAF domain-containing protein